MIAAKVGLKSRILLLEKAAEKGFKIFACKDPSKKIAELKDWLSKRKEDRAKKMKSKKESSAVKVKKKKAELEEKVTAEEKKKEEKKEMEKILTKRG
ncbi:MAG TPA: hypothetical protein ENF94_00200 [Candidatus Woesearchaeota archaeon]|nr:hypothetical protein [Candidatus Woesearchaeota archaeon]